MSASFHPHPSAELAWNSLWVEHLGVNRVDALSLQAEVIELLPGIEPELRVANNQPVLGTLLAALKISEIDYLITGDKDLLAMSERIQ
ncbi:MAG: hypothetical protein WCI39_05160 [Gallionellaceae bacterium]